MQEKSSRALEDKILDSKEYEKLREEIRILKKENDELRGQKSTLTTQLLSSEKLLEELREQNNLLTTRILSYDKFVDCFEREILLHDDSNGT